MAKPQQKRQPVPGGSVVAILDDFLDLNQENRAPKPIPAIGISFSPSSASAEGWASKPEPRSRHQVAGDHKGWNSTTKRNAITALQRGFNWAVRNRGLTRNPIRGMEKPEAKRRTSTITVKKFDDVLKHVQDVPFRDLLIVSFNWAVNQETKQLEARHLQLDRQRAVIPGEEAKGHRTRAIYFPTDRSLETVQRLAKEYPDGPLFRNNHGKPWTGFAVTLHGSNASRSRSVDRKWPSGESHRPLPNTTSKRPGRRSSPDQVEPAPGKPVVKASRNFVRPSTS